MTAGPASLRLARSTLKLRSDLPLVLLDVALVAVAYVVGLVVRFDGQVPAGWWSALRVFLPAAVAVHLVANWSAGLYDHMWRHAGIDEARRIAAACAGASAVLATLFLPGDRQVPLSVVVLGGGLAVTLLGAQRFHTRLFAFHGRGGGPRLTTRVVVVGAGDSGAAIVRELRRTRSGGLVPVAVVDDDPATQGRLVAGVPVVGGIDDLPRAVAAKGAEQAMLAIPSADSALVRRVAAAADAAGVPLKVLPGVVELLGGTPSVRDVRDLSIEDLLGRVQVRTDLDAVRGILRGRRVLITGAGGSIGSEIARQVSACEPAALLLLDHDETHLHDAAATVRGGATQLLADIRDRELVDLLFDRHRPEVVFHAAAHKHVPLLEDHPCEAVTTNVLGTRHVIDAAARTGVGRLVFISTDKAVRPSSVMGASKRVGEQVLLARSPAGRPWCAVRFGNVLGSRGSVIPTFMRQIRRGEAVTVTDPRMTRFFMSIEEAVQLVLQAAALAGGGEVFMLEMGAPVRILDLAERMIRLSGKRVGTDIPIRITGIRPGEKLTEELHTPEEIPTPTAHPSIVALHPEVLPRAHLDVAVSRLAGLARAHDAEAGPALLALAGTVGAVPDLYADAVGTP